MLALMCEAFRLPFASAKGPFYQDPFLDLNNKRVLVEDGIIASCLTIVPRTMWIGYAQVPIAGIADVATLVSHRCRGFATKLLIDTLAELNRRGIGICLLMPYSPDFYKPLGWEACTIQAIARFSRSAVPAFTDAKYVRKPLPTDRDEVAVMYEVVSRGCTGRCDRDNRRWGHLFDQNKGQLVYFRGKVEGCAIYEKSEQPGADEPLRIVELFAKTERAERGLLAAVAAQEACSTDLEVCLSPAGQELSMPSVLAGPAWDESVTVHTLPGAMARVVNLHAALEQLAPNFQGFNGTVSIQVTDEQADECAPRVVTVEGDGRTVHVRPAGETENARKRIRGSVRAWSPVLMGYHSLEDAISLKRLHAYSESVAELAAPLFPRRAPCIPPLDHF